MDFRFIPISNHHLLESEHALRKGFSPAYAFREVMRHIADNAAQQVDFILSTGDAVDPLGEQGYRNFRSFPRSAWEGDLRSHFETISFRGFERACSRIAA